MRDEKKQSGQAQLQASVSPLLTRIARRILCFLAQALSDLETARGLAIGTRLYPFLSPSSSPHRSALLFSRLVLKGSFTKSLW